MRTIHSIQLLSIFFLNFFLSTGEIVAEPLGAGFDANFRFYNQLGLKGKIAFTAKMDGFDRILVVDLSKKRIGKLIDHPGNNSYPSWSPKGDKIAFTSDRDGNKEIYIANEDGSGLLRITNNQDSDDNVNWSKDGKTLVFYSGSDSSGKSPETNLYTYDFASKTVKKLTNLKGKNSVPEFSKDGRFVTYTTSRFWPGWDVCIVDLRNNSDSCPLSGTSTYCRASFSNDGKLLAYSSGLVSSVDAYAYNFESKSSEKIVEADGNEYDIKWSADDKFIIFASDKEKKDQYNIYALKLDDKDSSPSLLVSSPYSLRYLSWFQEPLK